MVGCSPGDTPLQEVGVAESRQLVERLGLARLPKNPSRAVRPGRRAEPEFNFQIWKADATIRHARNHIVTLAQPPV